MPVPVRINVPVPILVRDPPPVIVPLRVVKTVGSVLMIPVVESVTPLLEEKEEVVSRIPPEKVRAPDPRLVSKPTERVPLVKVVPPE